MARQLTYVATLALTVALGASSALAEIVQIVNRIDPDPDVDATDATYRNDFWAMIDDGPSRWATPATYIRNFPTDATAAQARFVVLGATSQQFYGSVERFDNYDFRIHFWVDPYTGDENSPGSFESNARGRAGPGHSSFLISAPEIVDFDPSDFSFLITVDLAPLGVEFEEGRDYAMALVAENGPNEETVFLVESIWAETDDDDRIQQDLFDSSAGPPGLISEDHGSQWPAFATSLTVLVPDSSLVGDLTSDGAVDFQDLTLLLAAWDTMVSAHQGNLVDPGTTPVDFQDLTLLLANWTGPVAAAAPETGQLAAEGEAVPEPSALWLSLSAFAGLSLRGTRRRRR